MTHEKFARICDATHEGMNAGYVFGDGEAYFLKKSDAEKYALDMGYSNLNEAYEDDAYYYTEWDAEDEGTWYEKRDGQWYEITKYVTLKEQAI